MSRFLAAGTAGGHCLGLVQAKVTASPLDRVMGEMDLTFRRPRQQGWTALRPVMQAVAQAEV